MNSDQIDHMYQAYLRAVDGLETTIRKAFPKGARVRFRCGRGWAYGVARGHSHKASVAVAHELSGKVHNVWFRDVEKV